MKRLHFTTAYCAWGNETPERFSREVLKVARELSSEWKLREKQRPAIVNSIQKVIKQSRTKYIRKVDDEKMLCPMTLFIRLNPLGHLIWPLQLWSFRNLKALALEKHSQRFNQKYLRRALVQMHMDIETRKQHERTQAPAKHSAKTNLLLINIKIGDYVIVRTNKKRLQRLQLLWRGPFRMTQARSHLLLEEENINDGSISGAHTQRLLPYPATRRGEQASTELKRQSEQHVTQYHVV